MIQTTSLKSMFLAAFTLVKVFFCVLLLEMHV